ncbi:MAG TPA: ATP-binding protein [Planctomycetota bacterium]
MRQLVAGILLAEGVVLLLGWATGLAPGGLAARGCAALVLVGWMATRHARRAVAEPVPEAVRVELDDERKAALALTTALVRAVDVAEAAEVVTDALCRLTGLERTAVLLFQADGVCRFAGWRGLSAEYRRAVEGHCPWPRGVPEPEPIVVPDALADASLAAHHATLRSEGIGALAFVPVLVKGGVDGKLMLYGPREGSIPASSVRAAQVAAAFLGAAVTRLRMGEALARSESRLRAVIDTAMDAVVSMDAHGRITGWNVQAEAIFGWSAHEVLGLPLDEVLIPEEQRAAHREGLARYRQSGASGILGRRLEVPALRRDGTRLTAELAITRVRSTDGVLFSGFLRDITAQKRAAAELVEARAAAEEASRAKSAFLANMSHEIRTPLTAILGYAELLRDDGDLARAPERRIETIDTILGAGEHLLTVINDILDISKIEAGKMTVEALETPVLAILREIESLMRPRATEKGVELSTRLAGEVPERIQSDPTRLRQILVNLVGNAIKFTADGRITLTAGTSAGTGPDRRLWIEVDDTGTGMTPAQVARLFRPFAQADPSVTRRHGGSGLGLVISNRLAQLLGGAVVLARSEPGHGSTFRLELPLVVPEQVRWSDRLDAPLPRPAREEGPEVRLAGRVLLAEDGRDNQLLVTLLLRRAGAVVDVADNGRAALAMLELAEREGRPFDLLLTDIQMPEMDGFTLTRLVRERGLPIPVVALTAHAMAEDRARCLAAGCDDYAVKPIDKARLLGTCARWLGRGAARPA